MPAKQSNPLRGIPKRNRIAVVGTANLDDLQKPLPGCKCARRWIRSYMVGWDAEAPFGYVEEIGYS